MSGYLKITGWSGDDKKIAIKRLAKIFRMSEDEAEGVMDKITEGKTWQFKRIISENQITKAEVYLIRFGFDVEMILSASDLFAPSAEIEEFSETEESSETELAPPTKLPPLADYAKPYKRKSPLVKVGLAVVLLAVIAYGLMQTSFVKDFLAGFDSPTEVKQIAPVQPKPRPQPVKTPLPGVGLQGIKFEGTPSKEFSYSFKGCGDPGTINDKLRISDLRTTQLYEFCQNTRIIANPSEDWKCEFKPEKKCGAASANYFNCSRRYQCIHETAEYNKARFRKELNDLTGAPKPSPAVKAQRPASAYKPQEEYEHKLAGCKNIKDSLDYISLKTDWYQTQTDFCKKKMIASPLGEWRCEPSAESRYCKRSEGKEKYDCKRIYKCIAETPDFNKASARKKIEDFENQENLKKVGMSDLTLFRGWPIDSTQAGRYGGSIILCSTEEKLKDHLRQADLNQTQSDFSCKGNMIASPTKGWICKLRPEETCLEEQKRYSCSRTYQCVPETPEYNRARFKKELEQGSG